MKCIHESWRDSVACEVCAFVGAAPAAKRGPFLLDRVTYAEFYDDRGQAWSYARLLPVVETRACPDAHGVNVRAVSCAECEAK